MSEDNVVKPEDRIEKLLKNNEKLMTLGRIRYHRDHAKRAFMLAALTLSLDAIMIGGIAMQSESPDARKQTERVAIERMIDKVGAAQKAEAAEAIRRNFSENGLGGEFALAGSITADEMKQIMVDVKTEKVQRGTFDKAAASGIGIFGLAWLGVGINETRRARRLETPTNG